MTAPLSKDLRQRLIAAVEGGQSCRSAAKRFGVAASTAIILGLIAETPDITLMEIVAHLEATHGLRVAHSSVWRLLDRHGMTFKKNRARKRAATT